MTEFVDVDVITDDDPLPPDAYWGGYSEHGELLHLAVATRAGFARSACGLLLTGGAWVMPPLLRSERCRKCVIADGGPS